ncbi:hypothetical protein NESM_000447800 [Novymonas esmeraldas]|uniref:Uncharacterized protein n=1 Tax=Novymonas esmeraldas TaxID=1808958 RepID=A0AAW0EMH1_9TRYP
MRWWPAAHATRRRRHGALLPVVVLLLLHLTVAHCTATEAEAQADGDADAHTSHHVTQEDAGPVSSLPTCVGLLARRAADTTSSSSVPAGRSECVLQRVSATLGGGSRDALFESSASAEAGERVLLLQLGPRTTAHHAPLQRASHSFFANLSAVAGTAVADSPMDAATAQRIHAYEAVYDQPRRGTTSTRAGDSEADGAAAAAAPAQSSSSSILAVARAAVRPLTGAVQLLSTATGAAHVLDVATAELMANARVFSWWSAAAWGRLLMRRRIVLRLDITSSSSLPAADGTAAAYICDGVQEEEEVDRPACMMVSRLAMATHASASLLRIVSFPPVAQLTAHAAPTYSCELSAVHGAAVVLREDVESRKRAAQQAAVEAEAAAYPRGRAQRTRGGATLSSLLLAQQQQQQQRQLWVVSLVRRVLLWTARRLRGRRNVDEQHAVADAAWARVSSISINDGVTRSAAVAAARAFVGRVREELGPHQNLAESVVPAALQQLLGRRVLDAHAYLAEETAADAKGRLQHKFVLRWEASLPAATPTCIAVVAQPLSATSRAAAAAVTHAPPLPITLEETCELDRVWLQVLLVLLVLWQLERRVAQSAIVRHLITGVLSLVLVSAFMAWYAVRRLQGSSPHLAILAAMLLIGGSTAVMGDLTQVGLDLAKWLVELVMDLLSDTTRGAGAAAADDDDRDGSATASTRAVLVLGAGAAALLCVCAGLLVSWIIPAAVLRGATRWSVRAGLLLLWSVCVLRNSEATAMSALALVLWRRRRWRPLASRVLPRLPPRASAPMRMQTVSAEPVDDVPPEARRARGYAAPLAVSADGSSYAALPTAEARIRRYEEDGAASTRRALEHLAQHLRDHPGRYATRLRDPNAVQRWAGAAESASDGDEAD